MTRRLVTCDASFKTTSTRTLKAMVMLTCFLSVSNGTFFHKKKEDHEPIQVYRGSPISTFDAEDMYNQGNNPYDSDDMSDCHCECPQNKYINVEVPKTQVKYYPVEEKEMEEKKYDSGSHETDSGSHGIDSKVFRPPHTEDHPPDDTDQPFKPAISQTLYRELEGLVDKITSEIPSGYEKGKSQDEYKDDGGKPKPKYHSQPGSPSKHEGEDEHEGGKDQYDKNSSGEKEDHHEYKSLHDDDHSSKKYDTNSEPDFTTNPFIHYENPPGATFDDEPFEKTPYDGGKDSSFSIPFDGVDTDASAKEPVKGKTAFLDHRFSPKNLVKKQPKNGKKESSYVLVIKKTTTVAPKSTIKFEEKASNRNKVQDLEDQIPSPTNLPPEVSTSDVIPHDMSWLRERLKKIPDPHADLKENLKKAAKIKRISIRVTDDKISSPTMRMISSSISLTRMPNNSYMSASSDKVPIIAKTSKVKKPMPKTSMAKQSMDKSSKKNKGALMQSKMTINTTDVSSLPPTQANVTTSRNKNNQKQSMMIKDHQEHDEEEEDYLWGSMDGDYEYKGEEVYNENQSDRRDIESKLQQDTPKTQKQVTPTYTTPMYNNNDEAHEGVTDQGITGNREKAVKSMAKSGKNVILGSTLKPSIVGKLKKSSDVIRVSASTIGHFLVTRNPNQDFKVEDNNHDKKDKEKLSEPGSSKEPTFTVVF